jgi:uncharacterized protein (DUF983 family)
VTGLLLVLLIGLRYQVGGDWGSYEAHYLNLLGVPLQEVLEKSDPGYYLLVWLVGKVNGGVYLVNLVCAGLFSLGLVVFCRQQPRPWLALAVAVPYLVIVLGMGYTRQGVALGLAMLGMVGLARQSNLRFVFFLALAATFHKSAVLLVPLAMLATPSNRLWTAFWVGTSGALLYWVLLADSVQGLMINYVEAQYQSEGATVRIAMNAVPAALLLVLRKRLAGSQAERNLWTLMALAALTTVGALLVSPSSTAVDRMALYLIPLQLYVFSRLPDLLAQGSERRYWVLAVVGYSAVVLFVWLNFAAHSKYWLPYQFYPLVGS